MPKKEFFEVQFEQAPLLKKTLDSIKDLFVAGVWEFNESGLSLQAMDNSHVAFVTLGLDVENFIKYHCTRPFSVGTNLAAMAKVLGCANKDDIVHIKAKENPTKLTFLFKSQDENNSSNFDMNLMMIEGDQLTIPETEYDAVVKMSSSELQRIIRVLMQIGDSLQISCEEDSISFSTSGDLGRGNVVLIEKDDVDDDQKRVRIEFKKTVNVSFAVKYLSSFVKATPLAGEVSLSLSSGLPLLIEYDVEDLGTLRLYLAPKVETDDNNEEKSEASDESD